MQAKGQCQSVKPKRLYMQQKTLGPGLRRDDDMKTGSCWHVIPAQAGIQRL
jgi:hypothetical protein